MAITVTEEMVQAARRLLPARWSMQDLHDAIAAALDVALGAELVFDRETCPHLVRLTDDGTNATCQTCGASVPAVEPADAVDLASAPGPAELGGVSEIADRYGVARSTVNGWMKRAEKIGMPPALATLAAGPVYNLALLDPWYQAWKDGDTADEAPDAAS